MDAPSVGARPLTEPLPQAGARRLTHIVVFCDYRRSIDPFFCPCLPSRSLLRSLQLHTYPLPPTELPTTNRPRASTTPPSFLSLCIHTTVTLPRDNSLASSQLYLYGDAIPSRQRSPTTPESTALFVSSRGTTHAPSRPTFIAESSRLAHNIGLHPWPSLDASPSTIVDVFRSRAASSGACVRRDTPRVVPTC
jgi:hypothetical protein